MIHKWNFNLEKGSCPHLCSTKPEYFHTSGYIGCCDKNEQNVTCQDCLNILKAFPETEVEKAIAKFAHGSLKL